jgi:hypothetical protein
VTITVVFLIACLLSSMAVICCDISLGFTISIIGATVVVAVEFFFPAAMCWQRYTLTHPLTTHHPTMHSLRKHSAQQQHTASTLCTYELLIFWDGVFRCGCCAVGTNGPPSRSRLWALSSWWSACL